MANPRIIARVSPSPAGDYGVLIVELRGRSSQTVLPDAASVAFWAEAASVITILARMEADDRAVREFERRTITAADVIAMDAAAIGKLADDIEARRKDLERRHG